MKTKSFLAAGIAGGVIDFLLGWLFYGILFKDYLPGSENENLLFIFLGCLTFGLFVSYIFVKLANITTGLTGLKAGAAIGLLNSLYISFFSFAAREPDYNLFAIEIVVGITMGALVGAAIGAVNGSLSKN